MLSVLLIGISLSMDAFAVAVTNGLTLRPFRWSHALWMGLYFGVFQCLMPLAGNVLGGTVSGHITAWGPYISFALLGFIGGKMIWESVHPETEAGMSVLSHRKLLALALATSIDALAVGVTFAFSPPAMGVLPACVLIGCTTFVIGAAGGILGSRIPGIHPARAGIVGGCVLIAIGIKILLEGLI